MCCSVGADGLCRIRSTEGGCGTAGLCKFALLDLPGRTSSGRVSTYWVGSAALAFGAVVFAGAIDLALVFLSITSRFELSDGGAVVSSAIALIVFIFVRCSELLALFNVTVLALS